MKQLLVFCLVLLTSHTYSQSQLNFDGYQDHVALNGTDFAPPWTAEILVRKNQQGAYSHLLTGTDGTSGIRLEQYINNNRVGITSAGIADWQFNYELPIGEWVHLAVTCDGSTMQLYVDGQQVGGSINGSINAPMGLIGLNTTGAGALNAKIDELRIWNTVLPQSSIETYKLDTVPMDHPQYASLAHYYTFDEGSGTIVYDSKGDLDGTIVGATYCPLTNKDIGATSLISPPPFVNSFSSNQAISFKLTNNGTSVVDEDFEVKYAVDGGNYVTQMVEASINPIDPFSSVDINFPPIDLTGADIHSFELISSLNGDENISNDTLFTTSSLQMVTLGDVTNFSNNDGEIIIQSGITAIRVQFYREDIFRIEATPNGIFNESIDQITVHDETILSNIISTDEGDYYSIKSEEVELRAYKTPLTFALYEKGGSLIWEESYPLTFGQETMQHLNGGTDEYFYGCGMQNGYFSHKNKSVDIRNIYGDWGDGTVPNPAPFYMSTKGYGVFRNTFSPGKYDFFSTVSTSHDENRFDAYYFYGEQLKDILEGYTYTTGRPFMMPRWGLEFGDADCYNDDGTTADVIGQIAQVYRNLDMPGGWILPNDGYSCGYEDLEYVVEELEALGFYTGLWTEDGVGNIAWEVGTAGTRCVKLDVALVGAGYLSAFNSGNEAFHGIENNSNARGFIWTVAGWAGTQRFATIWSGDQAGNWENVRFHIPTVIGSGLSGFNAATGDIDGIFGGSGPTYVRDLQWKCFTPAMMTISGWAPKGKQPWEQGEPYTSINRDYLKLKMRLTPYLYSYSHEAHQTGVPTARAMVLEFPEDPMTYDETTQYQFMSGESFLVAPIYSNTSTRDNIYLPEGIWIDYWDGTRYEGPMLLNDYDAPLEKLPLFVKSGAIIPMYPEMLYDNQLPKEQITFDIYPQGNTEFSLYEDDGHSQDYRTGQYAETLIEVQAATSGFDEPIVINVGPNLGEYAGKLATRDHVFQVHSLARPMKVSLNDVPMQSFDDQSTWNSADQGWYYDAVDKQGIVYVKTGSMEVADAFEIRLEDLVLSNEPDPIHTLDLVSIYPNPSNRFVQIASKDDVTIKQVRLFSIKGQFIERIEPEDYKAPVRLELPDSSSEFFVEIQLKEGPVVLKKLIRN